MAKNAMKLFHYFKNDAYLVHVVLREAGRVERVLRDRDHDPGPRVAVTTVRVGQQLHDSLEDKSRNGIRQ